MPLRCAVFALFSIAALASRAAAAIPAVSFAEAAVMANGVTPGGQPAAIRVAVQADALAAEGLTAGGRVTWFGATQVIADDGVAEIRAYATSSAVGTDGKAELTIPEGVPTHGTWLVVDQISGGYAIAVASGYPLRRVPWRGRGLTRAPNGDDQIEDRRAIANFLVVRPGMGAWTLHAGDGNAGDADLTIDGRIQVPLSTLEALDGTSESPPRKLNPKDVVAMVDPTSLELTLITVGEGH